ncbi:MAG: hypothetical protein ACOYMI_05025 [Phycisphaerales bacterium]|jgi:hypothetical protein
MNTSQPDPTLVEIRRQVQNREPLRLTMLFAFFAMLAVLSLVRRVLGDETLEGGALAARIGLLIGGVFYCAKCIQIVTRENEAGRALGNRFWSTTAAVEMALVVAMFVANQFFCDLDQAIEQLGSPIVLMIPLLIALWVTRLRPRTTLVAGCVAAAVHAGIAIWVFFRTGSAAVVLPTILSYAVMIVLSAIAGSSAATDLLALARAIREDRGR